MGENARPDIIPNRVSSIPGDEYFFKWWPKVGVKIDDRVSFSVAEFCLSEGWVKLYIKDHNGRFKRERGRPVTIMKTDVKIETYWR